MAATATRSRRASITRKIPETVRIGPRTYQQLSKLARQSNEPMTVILARAIERERRAMLFARAAEQWQAIEEDPEALAELEAERALWDTTVADGLSEER